MLFSVDHNKCLKCFTRISFFILYLYRATRISEITREDTVLIIGAGPTGICTLLCVMLRNPKCIIVCEKDEKRVQFIRNHYPEVLTVVPEECRDFVHKRSENGGADIVLEVAGSESTFQLAWECARPNAVVTIVALYDNPQILPLPDMYGKNLTFKTGGVDGCDCEETLQLIAEGKIDIEPLLTHTYPLANIEEAYDLFEHNFKKIEVTNTSKKKVFLCISLGILLETFCSVPETPG